MAIILFKDLLSQFGSATLVICDLVIFVGSSSKINIILEMSYQVVFYMVFQTVYNLFFHPLADIPGPKLWAVSRLPYNWHTLRGTGAVNFHHWHKKYGQVLWYCPNGIAYTSPEAWDEIYDPYKDKKHMEMDPVIFGGGITLPGALQM
jgi:hypothetical protein